MIVKIKAYQNNDCKLIVEDKSDLTNNIYSKDEISYSLEFCYFTDIITYTDYNNEDQILISSLSQNITSTTKLKMDCYYKIRHIIFPTSDWLTIFADNKMTTYYKDIYFVDDNTLYKYTSDNNSHPVQYIIDNAVEVEDLATLTQNFTSTNLKYLDYDYISICFLLNCLANYKESICNQNLGKQQTKYEEICNPSSKYDENLYKKTLLTIALRLIRWLTSMKDFKEADSIIRKISGCNGLCNSNTINISAYDCGCGN